MEIKEKTYALIDGLKATCQTFGLGNDGNEFKIITQVFLYKYLKFRSAPGSGSTPDSRRPLPSGDRFLPADLPGKASRRHPWAASDAWS